MIQTSALPESVMLSIGGSPVIDFTEIDHRVGCTLEEPGAIEAAEILAVESHTGKKIKDMNPPNEMVFTCTWGGLKLRCLVDCGSTLEAIYNTGNNAVPVTESASAIKSRHRLKTGGGTVTSDTLTWSNQGLSVQNTRVNVSQLTAVELPDLPYDLILDIPF